MSNVSKGNYYELKIKKWLESHEWLVEKTKRTKYNSIDFFGWFDLIAIKNGAIAFIQVKMNNAPKKYKQQFYEFCKKHKITGWLIENAKNKQDLCNQKKAFLQQIKTLYIQE